jgi:hypothetical protein
MILESRAKPKRFFDPKSKKDMAQAKIFFKTNSWGHGGCPFFLEFPYSTVPDMMKDKIIHKTFGIEFNRFHHVWGDENEGSN